LFITNAALANLAEIETTKLGAQKAQNSDLKTLSEQLRKDHTAANEKLQPIAQKKGLTFPDSLDSRHQQAVDKLSQQSGAEFDKALATDLLRNHARSVAMYQRESRMTQDPDVKEYVTSTLPIIKQHLESVQKAAKDVGVDDQTISSLTRERPAAGGTGTGSETETGGEKKPGSSYDSNK
jgi:putative membrane protein